MLDKPKTVKFKRYEPFPLGETMELVRKEMLKKGLEEKELTFDNMATWAGQHILITEKKTNDAPD